jgi:peptide/nickel transport system substrate-binding protein
MALPSVENGLWRIFPDGRMETRWTIRPGARWHDGMPLTADDMVFTATVARDPELPTFSDSAYAFLDRVEAVDEGTVVAHWHRPYVAADLLYSRETGVPLPRHLLEQPYQDNKANFQMLSHWSDEFVGAGPFRVREFHRGSHVLLEAFPGYALGKPRIDLIEVKFIPNTSTMAANLLAGVVDVTLSRTLSLEEAMQVRDRWQDGRMVATQNTLIRLYSQMQDPQPAILAAVEFRRALSHGIDRQQLIDAFQGGLTIPAHTVLPNQPRFAEIEASVRRYDYDPARAAQLIEGLGYGRGSDGFFRDASGRPLPPVEIRSPATADLQIDLMHAFSKDWERIGVPTELVTVPLARNQDREYRSTRPSFHLVGGPQGLEGIPRLFHSSEIPSPRTRWAGNNASRWANPEMDALVERYLVTIPERDRMQIVGEIMRLVADQLPLIPLFFNVEPTMIANRLANVGGRATPSTQAWNVHEWDVN